MATRLINAAGGNYSSGATWVGGVAPTAADDVNIAALTGTLTIDGTSGTPNLCRSFTSVGAVGTISQGAAAQLNIGDGTAGAFTLSAGVTYVPSTTSILKFVSTTTGNNITTAAKNMGGLTFDGVGGAWTFQDACDNAFGTVITLTNGGLTLGGAVGATNGTNFSSSNSNTRSLTLGANTWSLPASAVTVWDIGTSTGMTLSAATSTINTKATTQSSTFAGGGLTYGTVSFTTPTTATTTITGANTSGTLTLSTAGTAKNKTSGYALSANQTVTGTFTAAGSTTLLRNFVYSDTIGTARTISAATVTVTHTDFRDITGAGAGSWNFSALTSTANGDGGNNSGMTFTTPKNCYLKVNANANWSASNWFTTSGGSTPISPVMPLIHDTAIIDANASFSVSRTITLDEPRLPATNWTGAPNTPAFATGSQSWELYGSLTLISGMTHTGVGIMTYVGRGSSTLDGGSLTWPASSTVLADSVTGTLSLASNFTSSAGMTFTSGTVLGATYTINITSLTNSGATTSGFGTITCTTFGVSGGTLTLAVAAAPSGSVSVTGGTLDMNGFGISGGTTMNVNGGTLKLSGQINASAATTVQSGTILDSGASGELKGTTLSFTGGTSAIRKFTMSSTFAISSTADLTINPGVSTWVTSYTETGTTHKLTYNGTAVNNNGTLTVTAASSGSSSFTFS